MPIPRAQQCIPRQHSIHGGGFIGGGGYLPENNTGAYNGSHLSLQHNVVVDVVPEDEKRAEVARILAEAHGSGDS